MFYDIGARKESKQEERVKRTLKKSNKPRVSKGKPLEVVHCHWSGNMAVAIDKNGKKRTSEISTGARKKAAKWDYPLGKFKTSNGKFQWRRVRRRKRKNKEGK